MQMCVPWRLGERRVVLLGLHERDYHGYARDIVEKIR